GRPGCHRRGGPGRRGPRGVVMTRTERLLHDGTSRRRRPFWRRSGLRFRMTVSYAVTTLAAVLVDRKSTRLNSSHRTISYAVFCFTAHRHLPSFPTRRSSDLAGPVATDAAGPAEGDHGEW